MVWLAVLGESRQAREAHDAKQEQHRAKDDEHVVSDAVDDVLEAARVLIVAHQGARQHKAHQGRVDGVPSEDQSHANLWLVAVVEHLRVAR